MGISPPCRRHQERSGEAGRLEQGDEKLVARGPLQDLDFKGNKGRKELEHVSQTTERGTLTP